MGTLRVKLSEILATKEAARTLPQVLDRLDRGEAEHVVITRRTAPRAVLITVQRYEELLDAESELDAQTAQAA